MKKFQIKMIALLIMGFNSYSLAQYPVREGIAVGYLSTPNSFLYRMHFQENNFFDLWVDIPEVAIGKRDGVVLGFGAGYAMNMARQKHFCFMLRPQISFRYINLDYSYSEFGLGVAGAVVAHMDSLGVPDVDVLAGISLGMLLSTGNKNTTFYMPLTHRSPFGLFIGVLKYF